MSNSQANLKVSIGADIAEIRSALNALRGDLKKTQTAAGGVDFKGITSGLKGMFGAIGGLGAVALGINAIYKSTIEAEKAQAQLNAVLRSTGGAAGLTAAELNKMADGFQAITTFDDEAITGAQALLLTFTNIGRDVFPQATQAILDMSTALGQDLNSSTTLVGKALNDPIKGLTALTRVGVSFSQQQKDVITNLAETGRVAEAQVLILKELERQYGGSAEAARNTLGGALQGLKNDFNNLLEGDTGSSGIRGTIKGINDLSAALRSEDTKQGFADITNMVALLGQAAVITTSELAKLFRQASEGLNAAAGSGIYAYSEATLKEKIQNFERLKANLPGATPAMVQAYDREIAKLRARLQELRAEQITASINEPPPPRAPRSAAPGTAGGGDDEAEAKRKADADAAERKRQKDAEEREEKARQERIAKGLLDVNNALLTATGQEAQAAFNEIDAKYAQLLADLKATGQNAEILKVEQIIDIEKAAAQLDIFKDKVSQINAELRQEEANIADQVTAGVISQLEAERQINDARDVALAKMRQLQDAAAAYLAKLDPNSPEGQRALEFYRQLGVEIDKTRQQQNTLAQEAKDVAENAFAGLFEDLITGAKSAKDAFEDFVKAFVRGIARMIAERLAQIAVEKIFNAIVGTFGGGVMAGGGASAGIFHKGGVVGQGGATRRVDPALFFNAPRYHTGGIAGLRPNEVPAILERGEMVIPKGAVGRGGGGNVSVIVENNSGAQARTEESMQGQDKIIRVIIDAAKSAIASDIARGGTTINKAMEGRYGVNPQGVARG